MRPTVKPPGRPLVCRGRRFPSAEAAIWRVAGPTDARARPGGATGLAAPGRRPQHPIVIPRRGCRRRPGAATLRGLPTAPTSLSCLPLTAARTGSCVGNDTCASAHRPCGPPGPRPGHPGDGFAGGARKAWQELRLAAESGRRAAAAPRPNPPVSALRGSRCLLAPRLICRPVPGTVRRPPPVVPRPPRTRAGMGRQDERCSVENVLSSGSTSDRAQ